MKNPLSCKYKFQKSVGVKGGEEKLHSSSSFYAGHPYFQSKLVSIKGKGLLPFIGNCKDLN